MSHVADLADLAAIDGLVTEVAKLGVDSFSKSYQAMIAAAFRGAETFTPHPDMCDTYPVMVLRALVDSAPASRKPNLENDKYLHCAFFTLALSQLRYAVQAASDGGGGGGGGGGGDGDGDGDGSSETA
jgi:hypothetical protein